MTEVFFISSGIILFLAALVQILYSKTWCRYCARRFTGPIQFWAISLAPSVTLLVLAIVVFSLTVMWATPGG